MPVFLRKKSFDGKTLRQVLAKALACMHTDAANHFYPDNGASERGIVGEPKEACDVVRVSVDPDHGDTAVVCAGTVRGASLVTRVDGTGTNRYCILLGFKHVAHSGQPENHSQAQQTRGRPGEP